jgi:hypothetical protein
MYIQRYKLSTPKICYVHTKVQALNTKNMLRTCKDITPNTKNMLRTCKDITPNTKNMLHTYKNSTCKDIISMIRNMLRTYKDTSSQHQKYVTHIHKYKLSTSELC